MTELTSTVDCTCKSDFKSRGRELEPQPGHTNFIDIDHKIISTITLPLSTDSMAVVSHWRNNQHLVLVNHLGGLNRLRNSESRPTHRRYITEILLLRRKTDK